MPKALFHIGGADISLIFSLGNRQQSEAEGFFASRAGGFQMYLLGSLTSEMYLLGSLIHHCATKKHKL